MIILSGGVNVKKCWILLMLALLLTGCGAEETFETVADELVQPVMAQPGRITVELPDGVVAPTMESDSGTLYLSQDYEIMIQTMEGGDLAATIQGVSGYAMEELTVMQTEQDGLDRYEFVWASAGEAGDRLGRAVILDDGSYHYVMAVLRDAESTENTQIVWSAVFGSFAVA